MRACAGRSDQGSSGEWNRSVALCGNREGSRTAAPVSAHLNIRAAAAGRQEFTIGSVQFDRNGIQSGLPKRCGWYVSADQRTLRDLAPCRSDALAVLRQTHALGRDEDVDRIRRFRQIVRIPGAHAAFGWRWQPPPEGFSYSRRISASLHPSRRRWAPWHSATVRRISVASRMICRSTVSARSGRPDRTERWTGDPSGRLR